LETVWKRRGTVSTHKQSLSSNPAPFNIHSTPAHSGGYLQRVGGQVFKECIHSGLTSRERDKKKKKLRS
jgi:hypothetical protein